MIINNKKIDFLFTVGAEADMRKLCEGGNIEQISELLQNPLTAIDTCAAVAVILNKWAVKYQEREGAVTSASLFVDDVLLMRPYEIQELMAEIMKAMQEGYETGIELEKQKNGESRVKPAEQ